MQKTNIVLTGGGTAGHVIPNLAIADAIRAFEPKAALFYLGSKNGIEKTLVAQAEIPYTAISTGKMRRYFDLQNFLDLFRIPWGVVEAWWKLGSLHPAVLFSKGGFVAFPVVLAAWLRRVPIVIHDSDAIPGLATRLSAPFAQKIILAHETAHMHLTAYEKKIEVVGNPVRLSLYEGSIKKGQKWTGFTGKKPVLLVMGGSSGSQQLNTLVEKEKKQLLEHFDVIHISGQTRKKFLKEKHWIEFPYVDKGMNDLYALASLALTRAGANTLAELHALQIPALLYPLGRHASRGDQIANAQVMCLESELFQIADETEAALPQLLTLPLRPAKHVTSTVTEKIAWQLLSYFHD
ncbi:UDP-N-acetylglucosamine--N-acetylmuramyl-(pentapeptide) pyrophosphoryl-undecaprenol N-acetylglucosamine transferase [Candidatus Peregrinibacteria bacterium]|nr:MAG: UDP-N-acetylglucosamine--N-acetylmuramyl-(pentapeptide) pyrophosphoryl-undecaprenol N-acetylglucosamine transferase [Candidatus Peregrinibacteria bacterium]